MDANRETSSTFPNLPQAPVTQNAGAFVLAKFDWTQQALEARAPQLPVGRIIGASQRGTEGSKSTLTN
jgi:hypothetical protein